MTDDSEQSARKRRFENLVGALHADLYRYAAWLCRDPGIAEEVVQESLLRAWKSFASLRDDAAAKPWLLTIVRRENARYFERKRLETVDVDELTPAQAAMIADGHHADRNDDTDEMRAAIFSLADDYREPLVLQVLLGFSTSEIAEMMGIRPGAVLTRLHRARNQLKQRFARDGGVTE